MSTASFWTLAYSCRCRCATRSFVQRKNRLSLGVVWSSQILDEVRRGLEGPRFGYSRAQVDRRLQKMAAAFPEALLTVPPHLIEAIHGLPDPDDRHVVALAVHAHANTIVTNNVRDFPMEVVSRHELTVHSADDFLVHQYHLNPQIVLEKLDRQAAGIRQQREDILSLLRGVTPTFCELCEKRKGLS